MGQFELFTDTAGEFRFRLVTDTGQVILTSESYATKDSARRAMSAVRTEAPNAARYIRKQGVTGWSFNLHSNTSEVIGTSGNFSSAKDRDLGIQAVRNTATGAGEVG